MAMIAGLCIIPMGSWHVGIKRNCCVRKKNYLMRV